MQEIMVDRYLTGFVFEGGSDTQYLEEKSSLINSLQFVINQQSVGYSLWSERLRHKFTHLKGKEFTTDWIGGEDYPGTKSRKRMCVKRQQGKIELLKNERGEGREKIASCSGMKGLFEEKQRKSRR